jgi:hypothetical protein
LKPILTFLVIIGFSICGFSIRGHSYEITFQSIVASANSYSISKIF